MHSGTKQNEEPIDEIVQLSSFHIGDTLMGIDLRLVQEINEEMRFTNVPCSPDYILGIMNLRGQIVTVIDLGLKIGFPPAKISSASRISIVHSKGEYIGLLVDRVADVISVNRKNIAEPPPNLKGTQGRFFQGVIQTQSQDLLALLDVDNVLEESEIGESA